MMEEHFEVCAVVVTFHPGAEVLRNIALLREQLAGVIVVDNGSGAGDLALLRAAARSFTLLENESNEGIAAALNRGVKAAVDRGYEWVMLFDQDSTVTPGFVAAMIQGYREHPRRESVGIFCPQYIDRATGMPALWSAVLPDGGPIIAMTSGSLMPSWAFEKCGWFLEELFIDQVDVEYCFRLRAAGYATATCSQARLLHAAGSPRVHRVWGLGSFRATHHSALRRYYITRNRLWVVRKYWKVHRNWCVPMLWSILADTIKLVLAEDSKIAKLRSTFAGVRDAMLGRLGKLPGSD